MKRTFPVLMIGAALAAFVVLAPTGKKSIFLVPAVHAQDQNSGCSLARAAGSYGVEDSGTILGIGPIAIVSLATLDAGGAISGESTRVAGSSASPYAAPAAVSGGLSSASRSHLPVLAPAS